MTSGAGFGRPTGTAPTLSDVARLAGVSVPTVSKVLNGREDVAAATRDRVRRALRSAGYVHRGPARRRVGSIDLVIDGLDSFWAIAVVRGAEEAAARLGSSLTVLSTRHGCVAPRDWTDRIATRATDGVIVALSRTDEPTTTFLLGLGAPLVLLDPVGSADARCPTIGADNWHGAFAAAEHLVGLGHRRFGVITGPLEVSCSLERRDGFAAALARHAIDLDPTLVASAGFGVTGGESAAARLLDRDDPPTAIFAGSDLQAAGVYREAARRGLGVPADLSVVGFDDSPLADLLSPPLTTVRQPIEQMARTAVRTIDGLIRDQLDPDDTRLQLRTELVVRLSTAPPSDLPSGRR